MSCVSHRVKIDNFFLLLLVLFMPHGLHMQLWCWYVWFVFCLVSGKNVVSWRSWWQNCPYNPSYYIITYFTVSLFENFFPMPQKFAALVLILLGSIGNSQFKNLRSVLQNLRVFISESARVFSYDRLWWWQQLLIV